MNRYVLVAASACILIAGCNEKPAPYRTKLEVKEVMGHVIDPAAQAFWKSSGFIDTAEGTTSLTPTTDEGWALAENGAATIIEASNALMLPERARDQGDWIKLAGQLADQGALALAAADARDEVKMFDTGGTLYEVCVACHEKYLLPFLDEEGEMKTKAPLKGK